MTVRELIDRLEQAARIVGADADVFVEREKDEASLGALRVEYNHEGEHCVVLLGNE